MCLYDGRVARGERLSLLALLSLPDNLDPDSNQDPIKSLSTTTIIVVVVWDPSPDWLFVFSIFLYFLFFVFFCLFYFILNKREDVYLFSSFQGDMRITL